MSRNFSLSCRLAAVALLAGSLMAHATEPGDAAAIKERIKPVGSVYLEGQAAASAPAKAAGPRDGATIVQNSCFACHGTGAMGAPKVGDASAWKPRLAKGMDTLLNHAINGFNAMPPRGTCADCSDDELKAAIEHMIKDI